MSQFAQHLIDYEEDPLIIDGFAGGGGASVAIELALGRSPHVAINHNATAVSVHEANHPNTDHYVSDIFEVDPRMVYPGRKVGLAWFSPDCTDFSKAKGGAPLRDKSRKRRALAWVALAWAGRRRPGVIMLENVEEFANWGPLKRHGAALKPCHKRRGKTFRKFVNELRHRHGYKVEWRELRACDYGAATIRKRLYMICRCDGQPIVWPAPTHGPADSPLVLSGKLKPYDQAANHINFNLPMCSIFATKEEAKAWAKRHDKHSPQRPLKVNSMRRIARGTLRFVVNTDNPYLRMIDYQKGTSAHFTAEVAHGEGGGKSKRWARGAKSLRFPGGTTTGKNSTGLVSISLFGSGGRAAQSPERSVSAPAATITGKADVSIASAFLYPRYGERPGQLPRSRDIRQPGATVVSTGNGDVLAVAHLSTYHGAKSETESRGYNMVGPVPTIDTSNRYAVISAFVGQNNGGFYKGVGRQVDQPLATILENGRGHTPLMAVSFTKFYGTSLHGSDIQDPSPTVSANGQHVGIVCAHLSKYFGTCKRGVGINDPSPTICAKSEQIAIVGAHLNHTNNGWSPFSAAYEPIHGITAGGAHHNLVAAYAGRDFGQSTGSSLTEPIGTITAGAGGHASLIAAFLRDFGGAEPPTNLQGLVMVNVHGIPVPIDDLGMRMLEPEELKCLQGFPKSYIIDRGHDGRRITKSDQVQLIGNSVSPFPAKALLSANCQHMVLRPELRRKQA